MIVHLYRVGELDSEGLNQKTSRITMFNGEHPQFSNSLVLGTMSNVTVVPLDQIRWMWIEEDG